MVNSLSEHSKEITFDTWKHISRSYFEKLDFFLGKEWKDYKSGTIKHLLNNQIISIVQIQKNIAENLDSIKESEIEDLKRKFSLKYSRHSVPIVVWQTFELAIGLKKLKEANNYREKLNIIAEFVPHAHYKDVLSQFREQVSTILLICIRLAESAKKNNRAELLALISELNSVNTDAIANKDMALTSAACNSLAKNNYADIAVSLAFRLLKEHNDKLIPACIAICKEVKKNDFSVDKNTFTSTVDDIRSKLAHLSKGDEINFFLKELCIALIIENNLHSSNLISSLLKLIKNEKYIEEVSQMIIPKVSTFVSLKY